MTTLFYYNEDRTKIDPTYCHDAPLLFYITGCYTFTQESS